MVQIAGRPESPASKEGIVAKACFIEASMRHVLGAKLPLGAIARDVGKGHSGWNFAHMLFRTPARRRWACLEEIARKKWIAFRDTERNQGALRTADE